jgi:hypothetical protein
MTTTWRIGDATLTPRVEDGWLRSLGTVTIGGRPLRHAGNRWLPWFDTYGGDVFRQFKLTGIATRGEETVVQTRAVSDPDVLFREFRDTSGDLCFRQQSWDAAPVEAELRIVFAPAGDTVDGRTWTGFRYWFEYEGPPIHRLIDRATWEIGGNLDDVTICLRSWLTKPRTRLTRGGAYSTAGFEQVIGCMPGNMWARWSQLPGFDLQYGQAGAVAAWFDRVSLIRTVFESQADEDWLRVIDSHWFAQSGTVRTNPKTIVWSPDRLDDTDALNLWTRLQDRDHERARRQFGIEHDPAPAIVAVQNQWVDFRYATTYENTLAGAAELGAEYIFVDPPWENMEALRATIEEWIPAEKRRGSIFEKLMYANMCATLDWKVADIFGGETELKALCDRAAAKGVKVISWLALHNSPYSYLRDGRRQQLGRGKFGVFAAKESGYHPDTGYPGDCWPLNLHTPVGDWFREQILGVCQRTGLAGFLWDSFSNLGWWQVDYSQGDMRPQFDKMAALYAAFVNAGLYLTPEGICAFANTSMLGMHGGNTYDGEFAGYAYNSATPLQWGDYYGPNAYDSHILRGQAPVDMLFQCIAHKRVPMLSATNVPRAEWHAGNLAAMQQIFADYKRHRDLMQKRTVLKDGTGVLWENAAGRPIFFSFTPHQRAGQSCEPNRVYCL